MSSLEQSLVWPPVEAMAQLARNNQKVIAKDVAAIMAQVKAIQAALPKEAPQGSAATEATDQLTTKAKVQMTKALQGMLKEVQSLKRKLEESDKVAARHGRLCSQRLAYLKQVEALAEDNRRGQAEYERMDDEERITTLPEAAPMPAPASASSATSRNNAPTAVSAMEIDEEADTPTATPAVDASTTGGFTVTPQFRLDRIFADHLLRTNRPATAARLLASTPGLASLVDVDIFSSSRKIIHSLVDQQDCSKALAWCGENRSRLNKIQSPLEFDLRLQEFLTLVQKKQPIKAIEYARKFLAPAAITTTNTNATAPPAAGTTAAAIASSHPSSSSSDDKKDESAVTMVADPARVKILQEAMNLLVFYGFEPDDSTTQAAGATPSDAHMSSAASSVSPSLVPPAWHKYRVYWSPSRFDEVVREFRSTYLAIYGLPERSALEYGLNIGLSCIKTSACESGDSSTSGSASTPSGCPACSPPLRSLAQSLPVAQRTHSRLVCRMTGALMDDKNPPMALPNGYVYSRNALAAMAKLNDGMVTCPQTKQRFELAQARIAYVL